MHQDNLNKIIQKLNNQFRKSRKRLKEDFEIETSLKYKTPSQLKSTKAKINYINKVQNFNANAKQYRYYKAKNLKFTPTKVYYDFNASDKKGISKQKYYELQTSVRKANARIQKRAKDIGIKREYREFGKKSGITINELRKMGKPEYDEFRKRVVDFSTIKGTDDINKLIKYYNKSFTSDYYMKKDKLYQENYIKCVKETFKEYPEISKELVKRVKEFSPKQFIYGYYGDYSLEIGYFYKNDFESIEAKYLEILDSLDNLKNEIK